MILRIPKYYTQFQCIAGQCKDTCCAGWEINIDEDTYDYYQEIPGEFGKRLRRNTSDHIERKFILHKKRCPFLNQENLCDICIELGEEALCETCTEYPRSIMEYGRVREKCLSMSCEEAARIIFESSGKCQFEEIEMPEEYEQYDVEMPEEYNVSGECAASMEDMQPDSTQIRLYEMIRNHTIMIIQTRQIALENRLEQLLLFAQKIQNILDETSERKLPVIMKEFSVEELIRKYSRKKTVSQKDTYRLEVIKQALQGRLQVFANMEALDEEWERIIKGILQQFDPDKNSIEQYIKDQQEFHQFYREREYEYEHLMVYFLFRYGMMSLYDHDFLSKVKLTVISFLMIRDMDVDCFNKQNGEFTKQDRIDMARIYSKQVEHAQEILDYLEEAIAKEEAFSVEKLIEECRLGW